MEGLNLKRMAIALILAAFFGVMCAWGTSTVEIPGFVMTTEYLLTVFYARLMIGFLVGFSGGLVMLKGKTANAALRGGIMGLIASISISFYGGTAIFIAAGIVYGIITDVVATRLSS